MLVGTPLVTDDGVAVNVPSTGATGTAVTEIVAVRVPFPPAFVHVSVNVVDDVSVTIDIWPLAIGPTPLLIEHVGAGVGLLE